MGDNHYGNPENNENDNLFALPKVNPPPEALPSGWVVRHSRSNPGYIYYFHQDTGKCQWELPVEPKIEDIAAAVAAVSAFRQDSPDRQHLNLGDVLSGGAAPAEHPPNTEETPPHPKHKQHPSRSSKRQRTDDSPKEVRVMHILKKHTGSRRPASWRNPNITISREKAKEELYELVKILQEVQDDAKELRATFSELARTESDCSSAKRGGDLGFFGRKKMQPAFEKASFALKINEMSDIVETSSGVHIILRLG